MSLKRRIQTFIKDPGPVDSIDKIETGINIIDGEVHTDNPLRSPVQGKYCIGFHYESFIIKNPTGAPQPQIQKIKTAEVYTPFKLHVSGGILSVIPKKSDNFDRESHLALEKQYGKDFRGAENIISPRAKVRIRGKVKKSNGELILTMNIISVLKSKPAKKNKKRNRS